MHPTERHECYGSESDDSITDAYAEYELPDGITDSESENSDCDHDYYAPLTTHPHRDAHNSVEKNQQPECNAKHTTTYKTDTGLNKSALKKMHLHLRHASKTQMEESLRTAILWKSHMEGEITEIMSACHCQLGNHPDPHPIVGTKPPQIEK